jgi:2-polyprenyl-3-methyl-5-hydroxy-6-metoxy-1,4-benzoquinol methylase
MPGPDSLVTIRADVFAREPRRIQDGIPVFSAIDPYTENYERIAADHLRAVAERGANPWIPERLWTAMEASTIRLIEKYARPNDSILDVGVGLGRTLANFHTLQRHGMDISFGYLAVAREKGISVCYARIEDMPYQPGVFDVVACTDVLEHVLDLNLCIAKMLSVLKDGGILIVRVPMLENLAPYLDPSFPYEYVHLRTFDEYGLRLLFGRVFKCECLEMVPTGFYAAQYRLKVPWPFGRALSYVLRRWYESDRLAALSGRIVRALYNPIDVNVVVRKPHATGPALGRDLSAVGQEQRA